MTLPQLHANEPNQRNAPGSQYTIQFTSVQFYLYSSDETVKQGSADQT